MWDTNVVSRKMREIIARFMTAYIMKLAFQLGGRSTSTITTVTSTLQQTYLKLKKNRQTADSLSGIYTHQTTTFYTLQYTQSKQNCRGL